MMQRMTRRVAICRLVQRRADRARAMKTEAEDTEIAAMRGGESPPDAGSGISFGGGAGVVWGRSVWHLVRLNPVTHRMLLIPLTASLMFNGKK